MTSYPRSRPFDSIEFKRHQALPGWYWTTWPFGEIHLFVSTQACIEFAKKHALRVTFPDGENEDDPEPEPPGTF